MARLGGCVCCLVLLVLVARQGQVRTAQPVSGQIHTSLAYMNNVFTFDHLLGDFLLSQPQHLPAATQYILTYKNVALDRTRGLEVTGNPLHVYEVIKRQVNFWPKIKPELESYMEADTYRNGSCEDNHPECENWSMLNECFRTRPYMVIHCPKACNICLSHDLRSKLEEVLTAASTTVVPTDDDLDGAAIALARLQRVYRIPISSLMAGYIAGVSSSVRLSLSDCMRVARATHDHKEYSYALVWYDYCFQLANDDPSLQEVIKDRSKLARIEHNNEWSDTEFFFNSLMPLDDTVNRQVPRDSTFSKVCRGERSAEIPEEWRLQCHINHRDSPFLLLQPIPYEQIHYDPELYIFYDVISDAEINVVKNLAKNLLSQSSVVSDDATNPKYHKSHHRTSHTAWLGNTTHSVLSRLARRVSDVVGLYTFEDILQNMAGEILQVLNYGIGGHYNAHMDLLFKTLSQEKMQKCYPVFGKDCADITFIPGDRLATWMFYLSDVTAGGRTGFPSAGVSVPAVRGAAAFWYNLNPDGDSNPQTLHGGCPVLMGEKWVANKWIRENANFLRRPCPTKET